MFLRSMRVGLVASMRVGLVAVVMATGAAQAGADTLKVASFTSPKGVSIGGVLNPWSDLIEKESSGEIKINRYWAGALGRSPFKQYQLVTDGITDIGLVIDIYTSGQFPDTAIFELPYNLRTSTEGSLAMWRMYKAGMLRGYGDIKVVGLYTTDIGGIHTRKPIKGVADLRGLKIRATGRVATLYLKHIGAVPVSMAAPKMAEAVSRGVLDGMMTPWVGMVSFRAHNVTNYHYEAPLGNVTHTVAMNKSAWERLSTKSKSILDKFGGEYIARLAGKGFDTRNASHVAKFMKEKKRTFIIPDKKQFAAARRSVQPVYDEWIKKTPDGQKKVDTLTKILADIRAGN